MTTLDKLSLVLSERPALKFENGTFQTRRLSLDFFVNSDSLGKTIAQKYDLVSCLSDWPVAERGTEMVGRLLLRNAADFPNDRRSLYICPECGDLGCGAVSIRVEQQGDKVIWRDFGYENDWENNVRREGLLELGPFVFGWREYEETLHSSVRVLHGLRNRG